MIAAKVVGLAEAFDVRGLAFDRAYLGEVLRVKRTSAGWKHVSAWAGSKPMSVNRDQLDIPVRRWCQVAVTAAPPPARIRTALAQWWTGGADVAVAVLFWIVIGIIAVVATASSKSKWDTVIAATAMGSQAFFAAAVWRLGRNQFAFAKQVAERQHKIDSFPLREKAADRLEEVGIFILPPKPITDDAVESFRYCHLEISRLFSDEAEKLAFDLYEMVQDAQRYMRPVPPIIEAGGSIVVAGDEGMTKDTLACIDEAINIYTDLQNTLSDEMRIH